MTFYNSKQIEIKGQANQFARCNNTLGWFRLHLQLLWGIKCWKLHACMHSFRHIYSGGAFTKWLTWGQICGQFVQTNKISSSFRSTTLNLQLQMRRELSTPGKKQPRLSTRSKKEIAYWQTGSAHQAFGKKQQEFIISCAQLHWTYPIPGSFLFQFSSQSTIKSVTTLKRSTSEGGHSLSLSSPSTFACEGASLPKICFLSLPSCDLVSSSDCR